MMSSFIRHVVCLFLMLLVGPELLGKTPDEPAASGAAEEQFFEARVRPVLLERCSRCHGASKQEGGLRVDSRRSLVVGGDSGPAIRAGNAEGSLLIQAIRRQGELEMPPDERLPLREIEALERWVESGSRWPDESTRPDPELMRSSAAAAHWAFQPIKLPAVPSPPAVQRIHTPVDAFVAIRRSELGIPASPPADRRTLIRRVTYSLTGLLPNSEEVSNFVHDDGPFAYERLVESLLESPQYGEQWARHWLDVARYSDTKGYVYAREERTWTHAWPYRDWVVRSLNEDMPYDRFLLLQIAADQIADRRPGDLAAMGFLTLGRRFLGVRRDIIDDRIDVVCRGTMGLTVSCARCHDHKYDPIPTADYYSLYGVFDSCFEQHSVLDQSAGDTDFHRELTKHQNAMEAKYLEAKRESSQRARQRIADYLFAQIELAKYPPQGFDQIFQKDDLLPAFVRRWQRYLRRAELRDDPVFAIWHAYKALALAGDERLADVAELPRVHSNSRVSAAFTSRPRSFRDVCNRYADVLIAVASKWNTELAAADGAERPRPTRFSDPHLEQLRQVLFGDEAPCRVPDGPLSFTERFFDNDTCVELWKLQGEIDRWLIKSPHAIPVALALVDQPVPVEPRVFRRGNPQRLGDDVPRQFLGVVAGEDRSPFRAGSGRLELARAIIDPGNPLTARVLVNRVWAHHFGKGLVATPSDFGLRADRPSHPELLDWLASQFVRNNWSLKQLHRWIVLSATYRQVSVHADDSVRRRAEQLDPDNRFLSRMNVRRLSFEELRDSLLQVSGELDDSIGGKPAELFRKPFPKRRTLYGLVDRQYFPATLRMFDFANPDLHVPQRIETTVPQQALFLMNHPLVLERVRALAARARLNRKPRDAVGVLFRSVCQRDPTDVEMDESLTLVEAAGEQWDSTSDFSGLVEPLDAWEQLAHVLVCSNEFLFVD